MWKRRIGKKIVETLCEKDFRSFFQEEVFHARGEVVFLQGALITDLIISFMYEQRPFHSRIRVNKPNFRLNPFNGGAAYLLTGRWTCVHGSLLSLSRPPLLPLRYFDRNRNNNAALSRKEAISFPARRPSRMLAKLPGDPYLSELSSSPTFIPPRFASFSPGGTLAIRLAVVVGLIKAWTASF